MCFFIPWLTIYKLTTITIFLSSRDLSQMSFALSIEKPRKSLSIFLVLYWTVWTLIWMKIYTYIHTWNIMKFFKYFSSEKNISSFSDSLFELKLIDLPVIPFFPPDSMVEWSDYRFFGLRSASAYLLVYDVSVPSTFSFVKALREQMYESRDMANIPVIVVANKMDLVASIAASNNSKNNSSHHPLISERWKKFNKLGCVALLWHFQMSE